MLQKKKIIQVNNLSKRYKKEKNLALDGVSFYVEKGAFFALLGPNGAGKTTILSILNTTLSKTSGEAVVVGLDVEKDSLMVSGMFLVFLFLGTYLFVRNEKNR